MQLLADMRGEDDGDHDEDYVMVHPFPLFAPVVPGPGQSATVEVIAQAASLPEATDCTVEVYLGRGEFFLHATTIFGI